jgi:hypothetical protein
MAGKPAMKVNCWQNREFVTAGLEQAIHGMRQRLRVSV